jgi:hypothetical protein
MSETTPAPAFPTEGAPAPARPAPAPTAPPAAPAQEPTDWQAEARKWEKRAKDNKTEADQAKATIAARNAADALAKVRDEVATATGVPAAALRGDTKEELEAHAAELKPFIAPTTGPIIPTQGDEPTRHAPQSDWGPVLQSIGQRNT